MGAGRPAKMAKPSAEAAASQDPLPELPDPALTAAYACEVLRTSKGLLKGCWGVFEPEAFYRPLPGDSASSVDTGLRALRHALILALDVVSYAEREGETVEAEELGEGSYARVFGAGRNLAVKVISDRERPWVHKAAVEHAILADRLLLGPRVFGHGLVEQKLGGHFRGTCLFLERLSPLGGEGQWREADSEALLSDVAALSARGFHNDLKLPNVLRRSGRPTLIDFDLFSPWTIKVAVTSSCLEHDFQGLLEPLGEAVARHFREYYDLFSLSLTLEDGPLYRRVLKRLVELWPLLEVPALRPLLESTDSEKLREVPLEVLVRVPLQGVSVSLLDLRGNLYVHLPGEAKDRQSRLHSCEHLPQLLVSNGVYWP